MLNIKEFLQAEIRPALGCTEPVCIALSCAHAALAIPDRVVEEIEVTLSPGLYKNAKGVFLPGSIQERGVHMAAALGAIAGDPTKDLEIFSSHTDTDIQKARQLVSLNKVSILIDEKKRGIYCRAKIKGGSNTSEAVISGLHNNLISIKLNGNELLTKDKHFSNHKQNELNVIDILKETSCDDLFDLLDKLSTNDLDFLKKGVEMNVNLAMEGLNGKWGYNVTKTFLDYRDSKKEDLETEIKKYVVAAVDARMGGCPYPAMSSAGSGNNGIVATVPVWVVKSHLKISEQDFLKSVCLSHLFTSKLKSHMGRITPVCSCGLSAGGGVAAAISFLMTNNKEIAKRAVNNHIVSMFGILCDGAKPGCSLKVLMAISSALNSISLAKKGISLTSYDGISGQTLDDTLKNIELLSKDAYTQMDIKLLKVISQRKSSLSPNLICP